MASVDVASSYCTLGRARQSLTFRHRTPERPVWHLLRAVPMYDLHFVSCLAQPVADVLRDHHRTMLTSRTPERDRQVALSFMDVVRQQIDQQLRNARDEFLRLRKRSYIARHLGIASRKRPELRDKMRIGKKANVKYQVGVFGHSMLESETYARHQDVLVGLLLVEPRRDVGAQLM